MQASKHGDIVTAAQKGDVKQLQQCISLGATVDEPDSDGNTPLMIAAWKGCKAAVEFLIAHGANVNHTSRFGDFALRWAAFNDHKDVCELLLNAGAEKNTRKDGKTAAEQAREREHRDLAEFIEVWSPSAVKVRLCLPFLPAHFVHTDRLCPNLFLFRTLFLRLLPLPILLLLLPLLLCPLHLCRNCSLSSASPSI